MTPSAVTKPSKAWVPGFRGFLSIFSVGLVIAAVVPPVWGWSLRYGFVEAIQFCVLGFIAPVLFAVGAPWRGLRPTGDVNDLAHQFSWFRRWNSRRVREKAQRRALSAGAATVVMSIFWRIPAAVNGVVHHPWLVFLEAVSLFIPSLLLMVEIVESPPLTPGISRPYRIGLTAVIMWSAWVVAYLAGMSHSSWYQAFHHGAGYGISATVDQQFSAGFVWLLTAVIFLPIIFWNLVHWLQSEEDPDEDFIKLFRQEREHGFFGNAD